MIFGDQTHGDKVIHQLVQACHLDHGVAFGAGHPVKGFQIRIVKGEFACPGDQSAGKCDPQCFQRHAFQLKRYIRAVHCGRLFWVQDIEQRPAFAHDVQLNSGRIAWQNRTGVKHVPDHVVDGQIDQIDAHPQIAGLFGFPDRHLETDAIFSHRQLDREGQVA